MTTYLLITVLAACSGSVPQTRYYQLASPAPASGAETGGSVLAIEPLVTEGAYDDERIVYRLDPVRFDYYAYHHWSTTPGAMVGGYLQQSLARSGKFRSVVRDTTKDTSVVLGGRVTAIEEIDESKTRWIGHLAVELTLTDAKSGEMLWSHPYEQREPLTAQTPEALARAIGVAMDHIITDATPAITDLADKQARARGLTGAPPVAKD